MNSFRIQNLTCLLIMVVLCWAGAVPVYAQQDIDFSAQVNSNKVALDSALKLTLTINGTQDVKPLTLPELDGFDSRYLGPARSVSIINGQYTSSIAFNYSLFPTKIGTFTIPSFHLNLDGQSYKTEKIEIEVVDAGSALMQPGGTPTVNLKDKIFLVLNVPKTEVYINEKLPVKVMLFIADLAVRDIQYPQIDTIGFDVGELKQPNQYKKAIRGVMHDIFEFDTVIYPTRTGEITLGPATLECSLLLKGSRRQSSFGGFGGVFDDSFFEDFFDRYEKRPMVLESDSVTLNVVDLPQSNQPDDFSGAVGNFDFDVSVSPQQVKVGDPLTLRMIIKGDGNLKGVRFPALEEQNQFKTYEPTIKEDGNTKTLEQVVIPTSEGINEFPALHFTYFDPDLKKYQTVKRGPSKLSVSEADDSESFKIIGLDGPTTPRVDETLGEDIVFIKNDMGKIKRIGDHLYNNVLLYVLFIIILVLWVTAFIIYKRTHKLETDAVYARRFHAPGKAKKGLATARKYIEAQAGSQFYDCLFKTLQQYLANKLHLPPGGVTFDSVKNNLRLNEDGKVILEEIRTTFEECDAVRYAQTSIDQSQMMKSLNRVENIIDFLERHQK